MSDPFQAEWLALRETFDATARDRTLVRALVAALPPRPRLLDLGAGTGSLFRSLAPLIGGAQRWVFVDEDDALIEAAFAQCDAWARRHGWMVTFPGHAMLVHTPAGAWRVEALIADLAAMPAGIPFADADAVLCSALLDLVSASWLERLADALHVPFYAALSVTGHDRFLPPHAADRRVQAAFRRDQARDKGLGFALGPRAPAVAAALLAARGFAVRSAASEWRIPRGALAMLREMILGTGAAARRARPASRRAIAAWEAARLRQAVAGRLAIRIGHRDILALPKGE